MKTKRARYIRKRLFNMAFILPLLIVNITFFVIPFVKSLYMSLFDWKLLGNKLFIGLANYAKAFQDPEISAFFEIYVSVWNYRYTIAVYCCIYYGDTG